MLSKLKVQHYKSLFDTQVDLEPLTVFIGPNGSGKSNICEAIFMFSGFLEEAINFKSNVEIMALFSKPLNAINNNKQSIESKFWHGNLDRLLFETSTSPEDHENPDYNNMSLELLPAKKVVVLKLCKNKLSHIVKTKFADIYSLRAFLVNDEYPNSAIFKALRKVKIYDFAPINLSSNALSDTMQRTGEGIAYALVDILHSNRPGFDELEKRLTQLVPNIKGIALPRGENRTFLLELLDKYSEHHIPASDISDGTLRILAFLTALYQEDTPSIICFEEIENGVHPWLLHKMIELLKIVSTEGINGNPIQVLITTHSPVLLNYVEPYQVRAVELDNEGKTQVHALPIDSVRFQKALEAYDGELGELWFTNVFGGNPE